MKKSFLSKCQIISSSILLFLILLSTSSNAQLTAWRYKDAIKIQENSASQKTNYQVLLTINTQTLVSAGKMQSNGYDIRFAKDCNGSVLYPYWIETGMNTANTKIWVLIDTLNASGSRTINMFYGNSSATGTTSFDSTFTPASRLVVTAGSVTLSGTNNYSWFEIQSGATVIVGPNSPFVINARKIKITGTLDGTGAGFLGGAPSANGSGPGFGKTSTGNLGTYGGGGAAYGAVGGNGGGPNTANYSTTGIPGVVYGTTSTDSIDMGSGGGGGASAAGNGGAGITLNGDYVDITGSVKADGGDGTMTNLNGSGAGGSGGGIRIKGKTITFSGTLSAKGGKSGDGAYAGGGGGGGRIKLFYETSIQNTGTIVVSGGLVGIQNVTNFPGLPGAAGTSSTGTYVSKIPTYSVLPHVAITVVNNPSCAGSNVTVTATSGYTNYNFLKNNVSVQNSASNTYSTTTFTNGNTIKVIATYPVTGCSDTSNIITMTINPLPIITVTPATSSVCLNSSTNLTAAGGSTYAWSPSGSLSAATGATVTATPTVTTTYTVTGTNSNGCTNTATATVIVNQPPVVTATATPNQYCSGGSSQLNSTVSSASGSVILGTGTNQNTTISYPAPYGQYWTGARHQLLIPASELTALGLAAGNITSLAFEIVTPNGTYTNFSISIGNTNLSALTTSFQTGMTSVFTTATFTPVSGWNTHVFQTPFNWDGVSNIIVETCFLNCTSCPTPCTSYTTNAIHKETPTTYASSLYYFADGNCSVCSNTTGTTAMMRPNMKLAGAMSASYVWSPASGLSSTTISNPVATPTATTTYTITATDMNGCTGTSSVTVTVNPLPTVTVTPAAPSICTNGSVNLTANGASTYAWTPASSLSSSTGTNVTANPTATTTYTITGTSAAGCTNTTTVTVTVDPSPTVTVSPTSASICNGGSTNLTASGANTYAWSPSSSLNSSTGANVTANPTATTTYTVVGTSAAGCTNSTTVTVTVDPSPTVTVSPTSATICNGGSTNLSASGANTYAWSPSSSLNSSTGANVTANPSATTTYTVTGTSAAGCTNSSTVTISVDPMPTITITPASASICGNSSTNLSASGANTYAWSPSSSLNSSTGANVTATPTATTTYTVIGTSASGCTNTNTVTVTVGTMPTITITPASASICPNGTMNLSASGANTYVWAPSSSLNSSTGANVTANPTATTTYTVTGTSASGCTNTNTVTVTVDPSPIVNLGPDINLCTTAQTTLNAGNFVIYSWSDGSSASTLVVDGAVVGPGAHTYYVIVTNSNGCTGSDTVVVNVSVCTGINELANNMDVNIYPNPTDGIFNISISNALGNKLKLDIMSIEGQLVFSKESIKTTGEQIDISELAKGVYFLKVSDEKQVIVKKIVLQ